LLKKDLRLTVDTKLVPTLDKIITTQRWSQFTETWDFQDLDKNVSITLYNVPLDNLKLNMEHFKGDANIKPEENFFITHGTNLGWTKKRCRRV
jgi:hypothetical protein